MHSTRQVVTAISHPLSIALAATPTDTTGKQSADPQRIDAVITWVDPQPDFLERRAAIKERVLGKPKRTTTMTGPARYESGQDLRYCLRSVDQHLGHFINRIVLVTNDGFRPPLVTHAC